MKTKQSIDLQSICKYIYKGGCRRLNDCISDRQPTRFPLVFLNRFKVSPQSHRHMNSGLSTGKSLHFCFRPSLGYLSYFRSNITFSVVSRHKLFVLSMFQSNISEDIQLIPFCPSKGIKESLIGLLCRLFLRQSVCQSRYFSQKAWQ